MRVRERTGRAGRRHLAGRQLPDSAGLESRGSCLPPCTSSITAYFPPTTPRPTTRADGGERKFNLSLPRSHLQERIRSPRLQNLPVIVRQGGKRKNHGGWVGTGEEVPSLASCVPIPIRVGGRKKKSPTGRPRNKWHRAFGGGGGRKRF